jgi:formylglycine-generating enzyme required for sulfatase activity
MTASPTLFNVKILFSISLSILSVTLCTKAVLTKKEETGSTSAAFRQVRTDANVKDAETVLIRGATFEMGTDSSEIPYLQQRFNIRRADLFTVETPRHRVSIDSFYLDKYEVTNGQFKRFVDENPAWRRVRIPARYHNGKYLQHWNGNFYPEGKANHPVINVSWYSAVAYCRWAGKRLPTEAAWEYAARGGLRGKAFPWGDERPDKGRANYSASGIGAASTVGSYPANGYGLYDMAGNVWEYVIDEWGRYSAPPQVNPVGGGSLYLDGTFLDVKTRRVIRSGSWGGAPINLRVAYRDSHPPEEAGDHVGFRCAKPASHGK